jgi:putative addiction module antidote
MNILKIVSVENSYGVVLPKEILERMGLKKGDALLVIETQNGIELTPYDPEVARQLEIAEQVRHED